jgi:hypothetical protein
MTDALRIRIAAAVTALFIGGLTAAGVAVRSDDAAKAHATAAAPAAAVSAPAATVSPSAAAAQTDEPAEADFEELEDE